MLSLARPGQLLLAPLRQLSRPPAAISKPLRTTRTFTSLPILRPALPSSSSRSTFRRPAVLLPTTAAPAADLVPRTAITAHPALAGPQQIRCGPRPTLAKTSRLVQKRRVGFLARVRSRTGRKILARRRARGRKRLAA